MTSREASDDGSLPMWSFYTREGPPANGPRIGQDDSKPSKVEKRRAHTDRLDAFRNINESFMVYRRFGWLHSRVLKCLEEELTQWEQSLRDPKENDGRGPFRRQFFPTKDDFSTQPRRHLLQLITQQLARYDEMILSMRSLAQTPPPSVGRYQSTREYLYHGPPIYMNHFEISGQRWAQYEKAVNRILKDPNAGHWLDGPLDQGWGKALLRKGCHWEHDASRNDDPIWQYRLQRFLATSGGIFFWILHITSALGFILADNASVSDDYVLERLVLAYWYLSAVVILIQGLFARGLGYARKVFVGGIMACLGGLYILRVLMRISQAASLAAMPAFFTIAMLLIRTM